MCAYKILCLKPLDYNTGRPLVDLSNELRNYQEVDLHWQKIDCYISTNYNKERNYYWILSK